MEGFVCHNPLIKVEVVSPKVEVPVVAKGLNGGLPSVTAGKGSEGPTVEALEGQVKRLKLELCGVQIRVGSVRGELKKAEEKIKQHEVTLEEAEEKIKQNEVTFEEINEKCRAQEKKLEEAEAKIKSQEKKLDEAAEIMMDQQKAVVKAEEVQKQLQNELEREREERRRMAEETHDQLREELTKEQEERKRMEEGTLGVLREELKREQGDRKKVEAKWKQLWRSLEQLGKMWKECQAKKEGGFEEMQRKLVEFFKKWKLNGGQQVIKIEAKKESPSRVKKKLKEEKSTKKLGRPVVFVNPSQPHGRDVSKGELEFCCVCGANFKTKKCLSQHIKHRTTEGQFECKTCHKKFHYMCFLRRHETEVHKKSFSQQKKKLQMKLKQRFYMCVECGDSFKDMAELLKHKRLDHTTTRKSSRKTKIKPDVDSSPTLEMPVLVPEVASTPKPLPKRDSSKRVSPADKKKLGRPSIYSGKLHGKDLSKAEKGHYCICGATFSKISSLDTHIRILTTEGEFKCSKCDKNFHYLSLLRQHEGQKHGIDEKAVVEKTETQKYACGECKQSFSALAELVKHRKFEHTNKSSKLKSKLKPSTNDVVMKKPSLETPSRPVTRQEKVSISTPDENPSRQKPRPPLYQNKQHAIDQTKADQGHYCICGGIFSTVYNLETHIKVKTMRGNFACRKCKLRFPYRSYLRRHETFAHLAAVPAKKNSTGRFKCRNCEESFESLRQLRQHRRLEHSKNATTTASVGESTETKNPTPDVQDLPVTLSARKQPKLKSTKRKKRERMPMKVSGVTHGIDDSKKGWVCQCGKEFSSRDNLRAHFKGVAAAGKFLCDICDQRFPYFSWLKRHKSSNHGVIMSNEIGCTECGDTFESTAAMFQHRILKHKTKASTNKATEPSKPIASSASNISTRDKSPRKSKSSSSSSLPSRVPLLKTPVTACIPVMSSVAKQFAFRSSSPVLSSLLATPSKSITPKKQETSSSISPKSTQHRNSVVTAPRKGKKTGTKPAHGVNPENPRLCLCGYAGYYKFHVIQHLAKVAAVKHDNQSGSSLLKKKYVCKICNYAFKDRFKFANHAKCHGNKPREYVCPDCNARFTHHISYHRHMSQHQTEAQEIAKASPPKAATPAVVVPSVPTTSTKTVETPRLSNTLYITKKSKMPHGVDNSKNRDGHFCICGDGFGNESLLRKHVFYFTAPKNFTCHLCPRKFVSAYILERHKKWAHKLNVTEKSTNSDKSTIKATQPVAATMDEDPASPQPLAIPIPIFDDNDDDYITYHSPHQENPEETTIKRPRKPIKWGRGRFGRKF